MSTHSDSEDDDCYCPALPPHLQTKSLSNNDEKKKEIVGPTLPPNFKPPEISEMHQYESDNESEDETTIGPLLPSKEGNRFDVPAMEYRMEKLINNPEKNDKVERESWMLELPSDRPKALSLGLSARQFRKNAAPSGDRSSWTDTPEDKKKKAMEKKVEEGPSIEDIASKRRDEELTSLVAKLDEKKRSVPLIDSHTQKKIKKEESRPKERKPFSREEDMCVNKFDEAQRETILKKSRQLNDRFSSGNRKFL